MKTPRFPFAAPLILLFALSSGLFSSCGGGGTPAPSPFTGTYTGSITRAVGTANAPLSFYKAEIDATGVFVCDATKVSYVGQTPVADLYRIRGTLAADGSTVLTVDYDNGQKPLAYSGKVSISGKKLTGAVAVDPTNNTQTIRLLLDLTRQ